MDPLFKIKGLVVRNQVRFTLKARDEMQTEGLTEGEVFEAIINATGISKTLRSRSTGHRRKREILYVIEAPTFDGVTLYTKGTIRRDEGEEVFYILVSAKRSLY